MAQLFPVLTGLLPASGLKAQGIYRHFLKIYPDWPQRSRPDNFLGNWPLYLGALMGDRTRVVIYLGNLKRDILDKGRPWPYNVAEAGIGLAALKIFLKGVKDQWE